MQIESKGLPLQLFHTGLTASCCQLTFFFWYINVRKNKENSSVSRNNLSFLILPYGAYDSMKPDHSSSSSTLENVPPSLSLLVASNSFLESPMRFFASALTTSM